MSVPSGLRTRIDGSTTGAGLYTDISGSGNHATQFNGVTTGTINGEIYMCFNGTTQYMQINSPLVTAYPFTMSAWIKTDSIAINGGIMSLARSTATNVLYNLEHNSSFPRAKAQNTTARLATSATGINTTQRFLVTSVFNSATSREIYVNGVLQ